MQQKHEQHLLKKSLRGGAWIAALRVVQQFITVAKVILLARLLAPHQYGLFAICMLVMELMNIMSQTGFNAALVQRKGDVRDLLDAAWTAGILRGVLLFLVAVLSAPWVIAFFDGKATFSAEQFSKPDKAVVLLRDGDSTQMNYLRQRLSDTFLSRLNDADPGSSQPNLLESLCEELNQILEDRSFFNPNIHDTSRLPAGLAPDAGSTASTEQVRRLNRSLIEDSFEGTLRRVQIDRKTGSLLLICLASNFLLSGLSNIGTIYFSKNLELHKTFIQQFLTMITDLSVFVIVVVITGSLWSLAAAYLCSSLVQVVSGYWISSYRPSWRFDMSQIRELWSYGKWIFGASAVSYVIVRIPDFYIGSVLGPTAFGVYMLAYRIAFLPSREISRVLGGILFPSFSKIQDDIPRLREAYLKVLRLTAWPAVAFGGLIFAMAVPIERVLLTENWPGAARLIQILALMGITASLFSNVDPLLKAVNKQKYLLYWMVFRLILTVVLLLPVVLRYDLESICWRMLAIAVGMKLVILPTLVKTLTFRPGDFLGRLVVPIGCGIAMILLLLLLSNVPLLQLNGVAKNESSSAWDIARFVFLAISGLAGFFSLGWLFSTQLREDVRELLSLMIKR